VALVHSGAGDLAGVARLVGVDIDGAGEIGPHGTELDRHAAIGMGFRGGAGNSSPRISWK
jgi:hypothetical protein